MTTVLRSSIGTHPASYSFKRKTIEEESTNTVDSTRKHSKNMCSKCSLVPWSHEHWKECEPKTITTTGFLGSYQQDYDEDFRD
jgi:hypothetical protein